MATLHDTSLGDNDASGTTLSAADSIAVTSGDLIVACGSCEGANGATFTFDTGAGSPTFTEANSVFNASNGDLRGTTHYWIADSSGSLTVRMIPSASRTFRHLRTFSFTPTAGFTFALDTVAAAEGDSTSPSSGSATAATAGVSVTLFPLYSSHTLTAGSVWTEPGEFAGNIACHAQYTLHSAGSLTGDGTLGAGTNNVWVALMAIFKEVSLANAVGPLFRGA